MATKKKTPPKRRPRGPQPEPPTGPPVQVRLPRAAWEAVERLAEAEGVTWAEWIRLRLAEVAERRDYDPEAEQRTMRIPRDLLESYPALPGASQAHQITIAVREELVREGEW